MGISVATIKRWQTLLDKRGMVTVERRGKCLVNDCRPRAQTLRAVR